MSEQRSEVCVYRTNADDLEMAMHALAGLIVTLDAINDDGLKDQLNERTLMNTQHSLIIAGWFRGGLH